MQLEYGSGPTLIADDTCFDPLGGVTCDERNTEGDSPSSY